jgi:hypothetical protein
MSDQDSEILLDSLLNSAMEEEREAHSSRNQISFGPEPPPDDDDDDRPRKKKEEGSHSQWAQGPNGKFTPVGSTVSTLAPGIYQPFSEPGNWGVELVSVISDGIYQLPDMATEVVLADVRTFWDSEARYRQHGLLYKRGILMWGSPGSGKTVAVKLLMQDLVKQGGIVIIASNVGLTTLALKAIKRIEAHRNIIVVFEDIDEIINFNGEANVLSLLDGETSIDRVLNLATTNYPERLGARIINRPSRFDRRVYVGMPSEAARRVYLEKTTNSSLSEADLSQWIADTKDMSIAHLRELVAAVYCLGQSYEEVIKRLAEMSLQPKGETGFKNGKGLGFASSPSTSSSFVG